MDPRVRPAAVADAPEAGRLLHRFNREFDEPTPAPEALAARLAELLAGGNDQVLLAEAPASGIAVLRFRPALWSAGLECYLAELYVTPERRRQGLGRALMVAALELAKQKGADSMDLGTDDTDHAAHALYESLGFSRGRPGGPVSWYYEREL